MAFGKKKKKEVIQQHSAYVPEPVLPSISEEQRAMSRSRATLDELIEQLQKMQLPNFLTDMEEAALNNEKMVDSNDAEIERWQAEEPSFADKLKERRELEEGLYILPRHLSDYKMKVDIVTKLF